MSILGERPYVTDVRTRRVRNIDFRKQAKAGVGADKWKKLSVGERNGLIRTQRVDWSNKNIGTVTSTQSGKEWLRNQDVGFQNKVLGTKQAELFRSGELELSKFYDNSGIQYNVEEMYSMHSDLFEKLGITP